MLKNRSLFKTAESKCNSEINSLAHLIGIRQTMLKLSHVAIPQFTVTGNSLYFTQVYLFGSLDRDGEVDAVIHKISRIKKMITAIQKIISSCENPEDRILFINNANRHVQNQMHTVEFSQKIIRQYDELPNKLKPELKDIKVQLDHHIVQLLTNLDLSFDRANEPLNNGPSLQKLILDKIDDLLKADPNYNGLQSRHELLLVQMTRKPQMTAREQSSKQCTP